MIFNLIYFSGIVRRPRIDPMQWNFKAIEGDIIIH